MCIFNELILWTEISREHPIFIRELSDLSNVSLNPDTFEKLDEINFYFSKLQEKSKELKTRITFGIKIHCAYIISLKEYIDEFIITDQAAINVYSNIIESGKPDRMMKTMLEHIIEEQFFMLEVFKDLREQMK